MGRTCIRRRNNPTDASTYPKRRVKGNIHFTLSRCCGTGVWASWCLWKGLDIPNIPNSEVISLEHYQVIQKGFDIVRAGLNWSEVIVGLVGACLNPVPTAGSKIKHFYLGGFFFFFYFYFILFFFFAFVIGKHSINTARPRIRARINIGAPTVEFYQDPRVAGPTPVCVES